MSIADNLLKIHQRIDQALIKAARIDRPQLIAVSKTKPVELIAEALHAGQFAFGENYLQDALTKIKYFKDKKEGEKIEWHFIGALQSNKTRALAEHFDWVHTLDRVKIARRLSEQRPHHLPPLKVCIQVNLSAETTKSGIRPQECLTLAQQVVDLPGLSLQGLMAIPEKLTVFDQQLTQFLKLKTLRDELEQAGLSLPALSMGMSADLEAAVCAGATLLRIGTDIFGARS